jgi:hypothetical protein
MTRMTRAWRPRLLVLATAAGLAACQSPANATPSAPASTVAPTVEVSAAPSPSAAAVVDVAPLFAQKMQSLGSGTVSIEGTATVGNIKVTVSGTNAFDGPDSQGTMTTTIGGVATTAETIAVAGKAYSKAGDGPWLAVATPKASDLATSLRGSGGTSFTDKGTQNRAGTVVHELVASSGSAFDPSVLLGSATGVSNVTGTTTFYCSDDGTPVGATIQLSWTQAAGAQTLDATMTFDMAFSRLDAPQSIRAPEDVWQRFTAEKRGYSIAYPSNYDHTAKQGFDYFIGSDQSFYFASRTDAQGYTLNLITLGEVSSAKSTLKTKAVSNEDFKVAGQQARLISAKGTSASLGGKVVFYEAIVVKGKFAYYVAWISQAGDEAADLALFKKALATFQFLG